MSVYGLFNRLQSLVFFFGMLAGIKKQHISHSWVEKLEYRDKKLTKVKF